MDRRNNYPRRPNIRSAARPNYDGRPLPAEVYYRRRRLAALFALLVVIGVVATLLFIRSSHESATVAVTEPITSTPRATGGAPATPTGSPKATSASGGGAGSEPAAEVATEVATTPGTAAGTRTGGTGAASGTGGAGGGAGGKKTTTHTTAASDDAQADDGKEDDAESEAAQAKETCDLSDLKIEASTDHFSYEEGQLPNLYMKVANPTKADCIIDLTDNVIRFEIYTMDTNQLLWSDVDCNDPAETGKQTFKTNSERYFKVQWSRTSSAPNACIDREPAPAGDYYMHAAIGKLHTEEGVVHSDAFTFNLQ